MQETLPALTAETPWLKALDAELGFEAPLAPLTWYKLGGPAEVLAKPRSVEALSVLLATCERQSVPVHVLGSGANLLVSDEGVRGVVVRLNQPAFATCKRIEGGLRVGAGYDLFTLVREAAKMGLQGLETIAGVPASLGGAVRMNAGGAFGEIGTYVSSIRVMDMDGQIRTLDKSELAFGYRSTNIDAPIILDVDLALEPGDPDALKDEVKRIFALKKNSQPMGDKSCGCVFKNPTAIPRGLEEKKPAGMLIDICGLKGLRVGGASVSGVHANFIVVEPGRTTAQDVKQLVQLITQTVYDKTGVVLQRELVVW